MQHAQNSTRHGWWRYFIHHVREEWAATIFVAAAVAAVHIHRGWFDAIDGYAYVAIGNASSVPFSVELPLLGKLQNHDEKGAKALVVLIDQTSNESKHLDRAPLNRCQLLADLTQIYSAMGKLNQQRKDWSGDPKIEKLDVLVIDLDISPALLLARPDAATEKEYQCQKSLYELIKQCAASSPPKITSPYPIQTVLMTPFEFKDADARTKQKEWIDEMEGAGVKFGRPKLPLDYGLVIKQYCDPGSLAGAAHLLLLTPQNPCIGRTLQSLQHDPETSPEREREHIDPRKYRNGVVPIGLKEVPGKDADAEIEPFEVRLHRELGIDPKSCPNPTKTNFKAVFFGAGFGEADTFLTPLGEVYGVEAHAAGFLSLMDPPRQEHLKSLLFDILFGFIFGAVIARCWDRYFTLKLGGNSNRQLKAPVHVFFLGIWVLGFAIALSILSWLLLGFAGIWSSPIPIAIGMLIESFVSGSVNEAIRVARRIGKRRQPPRIVSGSLQKLFDGDLIRWWKKLQRGPATLVALGLMVWILVVGIALFPVH